MLPDESAFRDHITKAPFLIGVDNGTWGLYGSPDAIVWPHAVIWCKATPPKDVGTDKYYFHFTLDGYPASAPMGTVWDITTNLILGRDKWPQWSDYLTQVFKWDWRKGCALYAPCDRSVVTDSGHQNWKEQHQAYWWIPEFTIVEYLRFLVGILNNSGEW